MFKMIFFLKIENIHLTKIFNKKPSLCLLLKGDVISLKKRGHYAIIRHPKKSIFFETLINFTILI